MCNGITRTVTHHTTPLRVADLGRLVTSPGTAAVVDGAVGAMSDAVDRATESQAGGGDRSLRRPEDAAMRSAVDLEVDLEVVVPAYSESARLPPT